MALWRENVRVERLKGMFISDEVVFVSQEGLEVTAFIGLASRKVKALLFILEDGRTFLTHTSRELDQLMTSLGGGVHAELEGIVWDPNNATAELRAYLREALALARDPES